MYSTHPVGAQESYSISINTDGPDASPCINISVEKNNQNYIHVNDLHYEIRQDKNTNITIYFEGNVVIEYTINYISDNLEYYKNTLENDSRMFVNYCPYQEYLRFKYSVKKQNDKLFIDSIHSYVG